MVHCSSACQKIGWDTVAAAVAGEDQWITIALIAAAVFYPDIHDLPILKPSAAAAEFIAGLRVLQTGVHPKSASVVHAHASWRILWMQL
jgi:hypothetical protein